MSQIVFFMTRTDLIEVFRTVESRVPISYVRMERFKNGVPLRSFSSGLDLPDLGVATKDSSNSCDTYLVVPRDTQVTPYVAGDDYLIDQSRNPGSITVKPAGTHASGVMLFGRVATVHNDPVSLKLMNTFRSAIKHHCKKIRAFYVGPEAEKLWREGARLTVSIGAPSDLNLRSA